MTLSMAKAKDILKETFISKEKNHDLLSNKVVTVCGGGNGAHVTAGYLAFKGIQVNVFTRKPNQWNKNIEISTAGSSWQYKGILNGNLNIISNEPKDMIPYSDIIIIAVPANVHSDILIQILPYLKDNVKIGALFGQGGFDWAARNILLNKIDTKCDFIFGLQNIPWICKIIKYGSKARIIGPKKSLYVASYPIEKKYIASNYIKLLFDIETYPVANFLNLTLTPSNQIIHPARYYGIFHDWDGKRTYTIKDLQERNGLTLYADMDEFSAEQLAILDNELQQIKAGLLQRFPLLDLSDVLPLGERIIKHYADDVTDISSLKRIFCSNLGYAGCATPLKEISNGNYHPATNSRLFWEDIPFGLCILKNIAELMNDLPTPKIDFMIRWHQKFMGINFLNDDGKLNPKEIWRTGSPLKYGIDNLNDLVQNSISNPVHPLQSKL